MKTFSRTLWWLVGLGLGVYGILTLWIAFLGATYPYQLDYGEGVVLWFTQEIVRGHSIYTLPGSPAYASSNYPPLAMLLAAMLSPIFGDGYAAGRLLNFASVLIVATLIYRVVHTETRNRWTGAIAALLFFGSPYVYHWVPLFRVDLIGLAFAFGGVYLVWSWERTQSVVTTQSEQSTVYYSLFTLFFLLALYTKQTLLAAPAAAFLALFARDKKLAIIFAIALGVSGGIIYLLLDAMTGGGFTFGLLTSNATVFLFDQLTTLLTNFFTTFPILLMLALWSWVNRIRSRKIGVLEWYALISLAMLMMSGRIGAWENYFFEAIAMACVFTGFQISDFRFQIDDLSTSRKSTIYTLRVQFAIAILLIVQLILYWRDPRIALDLVTQGEPANRDLATLLQRTSGTIISEDMGALATSGKQVAYYTFQYSSLARSGGWDQSWELNGLRDGKFPLVILEQGTREDVDHYRRFTRAFVSALDRYYAHTQTIGHYEIYIPAPLLKIQRFDFGDAIALVGYTIEPETLKPGMMKLDLVWQAQRAMAQRFTAFVHLENMNNEKIAQDDREPYNGIYPTTRWAANEMVRETYSLNVPKDLAPGKYVLLIGWYDTYSGDRLSVPNSQDDSATLATFEIK